jgi:hypothetical protein
MNRLYERFEEMADTAAPPSRLSADEVYAAAWRRRRWRRTGWATAAVAAVAVGGIGLTMLQPRADNPAGSGPLPSQTAQGWPADTQDGTVISAAATDSSHLFAAINACTVKDGERQCVAQLVGSDDGGRTWTVRQADIGDGQITSPAPGALLQTIETVNPAYDGTANNGPKLFRKPRISTDGGRTWADVKPGSAAVQQVPTGGWIELECGTDTPCKILAIDPATAQSAPLANQTPLDVIAKAGVPTSAGFWITGRERGGSHRPAVAVSHDRGRTWSLHMFDLAGADLSANIVYPAPYSVDGVVGYTILQVPPPTGGAGSGATPAPASGSQQLIYRTADGGKTWGQVDAGQTLPFGRSYADGDTYLAADGTHVVLTSENTPLRWYASSDGGNSYRPATLPGLSDHLTRSGIGAMIRVVAPGTYLAFDNGALYRSSDGIHWSRTLVRLR